MYTDSHSGNIFIINNSYNKRYPPIFFFEYMNTTLNDIPIKIINIYFTVNFSKNVFN